MKFPTAVCGACMLALSSLAVAVAAEGEGPSSPHEFADDDCGAGDVFEAFVLSVSSNW